uniref:non-specific serine/threonine protein kinase n=1 Tax=Timema monikensis TaxID=170555 RepID=A0A7R9E9Q5_9NEOP|nr:unnamed protein product [Timema monikensis]
MPAARCHDLPQEAVSATVAPLDPSAPSGAGSAYQRLLYSLQNDPRWLTEVNLGKRVGLYRFRGDLGSGNFSQVKMAIHQLTKEQVAIKILDKSKLEQKTRKMLAREIATMEAIHHPNIIRLYEVVETYSKIYLVMEFARGGELFNKLTTYGRFQECDAKPLFAQVISAVEYMHEHNFIHRDIKAENVFYSAPSLVKLGDFGFSTQLTTGREQQLNTFCGSPPYAAPELFRDESYLGAPVDVWALGVLLFFMVTAQMPFKAQTVASLKKHILDGSFVVPAHVSAQCRALIGNTTLLVCAQCRALIGNTALLVCAQCRALIGNTTLLVCAQCRALISNTTLLVCGQCRALIGNTTLLVCAKCRALIGNTTLLVCAQCRALIGNTTLLVCAQCRALIEGTLKQTPRQRLSLSEIHNSEWLKGAVFPTRPGPTENYTLFPTILPRRLSLDDFQRPEGVLSRKSSLSSRKSSVNFGRLSEAECVARSKLSDLGISEAMLEEHEGRGVRSSIIGAYRIMVHRVQRQGDAEVEVADGSMGSPSRQSATASSSNHFCLSSLGRRSKSAMVKSRGGKNSRSRTCALL